MSDAPEPDREPVPAARPRPVLPRSIRVTAVLCMVLSSCEGVMAAGEAMNAARVHDMREAPSNAFVSPELARRIVDAQIHAIEGMQSARVLTLLLLAICAGLAFAGGARMLQPTGLPRETGRRIASGAALICGILRTIDGAQSAVIVRRLTPIVASEIAKDPAFHKPDALEAAQALPGILAGFGLAATIALTVLTAGGFVVLSQILASRRMRQLFAEVDQALE